MEPIGDLKVPTDVYQVLFTQPKLLKKSQRINREISKRTKQEYLDKLCTLDPSKKEMDEYLDFNNQAFSIFYGGSPYTSKNLVIEQPLKKQKNEPIIVPPVRDYENDLYLLYNIDGNIYTIYNCYIITGKSKTQSTQIRFGEFTNIRKRFIDKNNKDPSYQLDWFSQYNIYYERLLCRTLDPNHAKKTIIQKIRNIKMNLDLSQFTHFLYWSNMLWTNWMIISNILGINPNIVKPELTIRYVYNFSAGKIPEREAVLTDENLEKIKLIQTQNVQLENNIIQFFNNIVS